MIDIRLLRDDPDSVKAALARRGVAASEIDEIIAAGDTPIVAGGTGLYFRAALSALALPPPPAPGERERWSGLYDELGSEGAHALLAERDPAAAARVHANARRRPSLARPAIRHSLGTYVCLARIAEK